MLSEFKKRVFHEVVGNSYPLVSSLLIPSIVRSMNLFNRSRRSKTKYIDFEIKRYAKWRETNVSHELTIFHDLDFAPSTYGDFLLLVVLARYFRAQGLIVKLTINVGDIRASNHAAKLFFAEEAASIAQELVHGIIVQIDSNDCRARGVPRTSKTGDGFLLFEGLVVKNEAVFTHAFDLLNRFLERANDSLIGQTLLSAADFSMQNQELNDSNYISIPCRLNLVHETQRNLSDKSFLKIVESVQSVFPGYDLMIVSDKRGCDHFKEVAQQGNLKCKFSQDYSDNFLGNGLIVLKSKLWVQVKAGGIGVFAQWSQIPHLTYLVPAHEHNLFSGYLRTKSRFQQFKVIYGEPNQNSLLRDLRKLRYELENTD